ncbi:eukaryotic translation initiation factor 4G-like isoform X1 [Camellia sinensis]|uniref:eukaryotic translation initiation factor 4G-like isoform X1 n=1 Tax=Camellia sinensis TaxID=4442 RepID=UPI00103649C6|nr:eukaryotic translation initiation factor 4G-like isoform X1 [Camellia sinensis]XP_028102290.1 eukaryotic translation initiation factor 4G-like isoform X1 [Camellia sinensis]
MSLNQSRAERNESHYRRPARPGISAHQRVSSGGVGKGGGGTGLPPASANSQSSSFSTTRSFKKTNGQGTQPRVTGTNANLESSAVHNGARAQPMLPGASNALFTNASAKPIDMHNQRSQQTASSAPNSASASGTSESAAPTTPVIADASKGVSLQFGSFSPNIVSGLQIPARTSSAPPNLDEQKRDQARHDSFGSVPLLPTSSISNRQQSREDVEQSKSRVPHHPSHDKRGVRAQAPAYSGATSAKSSSTPVSGASMAIPFQQSQVVQFGVPTPKIQAQGMATTSLQMPILGHSSQVQQQVFVPSIQAPPLQPQGMMRQGQGLNYPPPVGHQVSSQMGNLVIGMGSHFAQQQPGKLGAPRVSIKITDPKTHEELRLDKRADPDLNGGLFGHGSHANMPLQPQPVVYGPSHQVNYFSHIHPNSMFFQNPASLPLTSTTQMAPNSQASVGGQGSHVLAFKNPSLLNHSPAYKTGPPMHGIAVSSNLEHGHGAETLIAAASSVSEQVAVKPAALSNEDTVGPPSVSVSSNADNRSEATKISRPHNATQSLDSQGDSKIHMEISVQQSKSISVLSSPRRTETVRRIDSMEDQSKKPWKKDQHHFQMQQQANTLDSADHLAMKAYKEVAKFAENMLASPEKVEPSTSVLEDPSSGLEHVTSAGNRIPETVESEATPASSETCRDVAVSPGEALPGGVACVPVVEACVCETSNKSSVEIVFDEFNGVSSAKQDNCTSLDIQLKNENTGLAEHMKTEQAEYPQLDNNYNDDKVNIPSVLSSNTSADRKNVDITPSVFCNKHGTVETEQNMLEGASGCGSIVNEKTDNNIERSTAFANGSDSNVGSHFIVSSSSELRTSTLRGSKGESGLMDGQEASLLESGLAHDDTAHVPIPSVSDAVLKVEEKVSEEVSDDLVQFSSSGLNDNKHTTELNKVKSTTDKAKKKRKEFLQKAELAGTTSDLYMAYKGPEEKPQPSVSSECVDGNSGISTRQPHSGSNEKDIASKEDEKSIVELDDWEDAADAPKLENSDKIEEINGGLRHHEEDGAACKKYSRDFLLTLKDQCADLPAGFDIAYDMVEALMGSKASISKSVECNPPPSPGNRPIAMSRPDFRGAGMVDDDRWFKSPVLFPFNQDHHVDVGQGGNTVGFRLGQGGTHGNMRNLRGQIPGQYIVGLQSGPLLPLESYGDIQRNGPDADRWQRASGFQKGLIPSPQSPMQVIHKAANKYEVGKVTDAEAAKQRQLKAILNKLTPQNFDRLFEQVKEVNIDNAVTLTGVISQIFDKALMEPTFCEMYANFCHDLASELPDFVEDNEKITFKRLLLNKCQEEFERGEREQAEADKVEGDGKVKQSAVEREEKRVQARRRMLGNIRLIGELYKKRMLTERIMHECIKKLLGQYPDPEEEDIEALCKLMSTIGEMIDHPKAKEHMDAYFERMTNLSTNMKLSSRVRFMLKDSIDLRKNKWQQRRKVDGPKKIEEVHRDAAQERQQVNRLTRSSSISSSARRGQPSDFGPRPSTMFSPPNTPQGTFRGVPPQLRGFGAQGIRFEGRHPYENRTLSVPLSHRPVDDNAITLGPQGGLARGMSSRGPAILSSAPLADISTGPGESRRIHAGPNGYSSASEWMPSNSRQEPMTRYVQDRFTRPAAYNNLNPQEHGVRYGDRGLNNADRSFGSSMAGSPAATHVKSSATPIVSSGKVWPEEHLREMSMAAIREFYSAADEKEVALCIRELNSPSFYPSMISIWVNDSFERKDRDRDLLAGLLVNLTKSRDSMLISPVQLMEGIELVLATLEDSITDAPKAAEFLGCVIARTIVENVISMRDIGQLIRQGGEEPGRLQQIGLGYEVLQSAFHTIRSDKGESTLNDICMSSNLQLEDFLPSSGPMN